MVGGVYLNTDCCFMSDNVMMMFFVASTMQCGSVPEQSMSVVYFWKLNQNERLCLVFVRTCRNTTLSNLG